MSICQLRSNGCESLHKLRGVGVKQTTSLAGRKEMKVYQVHVTLVYPSFVLCIKVSIVVIIRRAFIHTVFNISE